jgi:hypothetical protein
MFWEDPRYFVRILAFSKDPQALENYQFLEVCSCSKRILTFQNDPHFFWEDPRYSGRILTILEGSSRFGRILTLWKDPHSLGDPHYLKGIFTCFAKILPLFFRRLSLSLQGSSVLLRKSYLVLARVI